MFRKLTVAFAAVAMSATLAATADAATTTVRLHTQGDLSRFLADPGVGVTSMVKGNPSDPKQKWRRTDTNGGFATYKNVANDRCLTGRGIQGFPVVTAEKCEAGALKQQWRLGVSGDLQLRLNFLVAKHNLAGNGTGVLMSFFQGKPEERWHTHPA